MREDSAGEEEEMKIVRVQWRDGKQRGDETMTSGAPTEMPSATAERGEMRAK